MKTSGLVDLADIVLKFDGLLFNDRDVQNRRRSDWKIGSWGKESNATPSS
jgi:hypothetical protein